MDNQFKFFFSNFLLLGIAVFLSAMLCLPAHAYRDYYYDVVLDSSGNPIASAKVSVYLAGTKTPAKVYSSLTGTSSATYRLTAGDGTFFFYLDRMEYGTSQKFDFSVVKEGYYTVARPNININNPVMGSYAIAANKEITNYLYVPKGVTYAVAAGATLSGPIDAGPYQIKTGDGTLASTLLPNDRQWYGEENYTKFNIVEAKEFIGADRMEWPIDSGLALYDSSTGKWGPSVPNYSANWNIAYNERQYWSGGSATLDPATGRASLGLGTAATTNATDYATAEQGAKADEAYSWGNSAGLYLPLHGTADNSRELGGYQASDFQMALTNPVTAEDTPTTEYLTKWGTKGYNIATAVKMGKVIDNRWCTYTTAGGLECTSVSGGGSGDMVYPIDGGLAYYDNVAGAWGTSVPLANLQTALTNPVTGMNKPTTGYLTKWSTATNNITDGLKLGTLEDGKYCTYSTKDGLECINKSDGSMIYPVNSGLALYDSITGVWAPSVPVSSIQPLLTNPVTGMPETTPGYLTKWSAEKNNIIDGIMLGPMLDTKTCTYTTKGGIECTTTPSGGGSMVYPSTSGIAKYSSATGTWESSITDNSTNWNTAFADRLKWDGGATGLTATTGRASLGLGTAATTNATDYLAVGGTAANSSKLENHAASYFQTALTNPVTGMATPTPSYLTKWGASGNAITDAVKLGALVDTKYCIYTAAGGIECTATPSGGGGSAYPVNSGLALYDSISGTWGESVINNSANWDMAYSWGNPAGLYLPLHGTADTVKNANFTSPFSNYGGSGSIVWPTLGATLGVPAGGGMLGSAAFTASGQYLAATGTAANSSKLEDHAASYFQTALTNPVTGVATPSPGYLPKWGSSGNTIVDGVKLGTLTDTKYCTYSNAGGIECTSTPSGGGGSMVYPTASGITVYNSGAGTWGASITDNSTNWNAAYTDRLKWDGGATGLTASTGRTSLGLGTAATTATTDYATAAQGVKADTAFSQSMQWNGGATGLVAATGRASLGLGTAATTNSTDYLAAAGNAVSSSALKSTTTTGLMNITGPAAGATRTKTTRDANDTLLEQGGSYTPTGAWTWTSAAATWPTFNQDTTGLTNANVPNPGVVMGGSSQISGKRTYVVCTSATTVTLPKPEPGSQVIVRNAPGVVTPITLAGQTGVYYEKTDHSDYGTVGAKLVSGGAMTDAIYLLGLDYTHFLVMSSTGTWIDTP